MPPVAVTEFQAALGELARRSGNALEKLIVKVGRLSTTEALQFITDAYPELMDPYLSASGDLTVQWYSEQPTKAQRRGSKIFIPEPVALPPANQLAASARWATVQKDPVGAIKGTATRHVFNQSRNSALANVEREGVRYARQARRNACGFCRMLATRALTVKMTKQASLYRTEGSASQTPHNRAQAAAGHDNCNCVVVPVRDDDYTPPDYVEQWTADYYALPGEIRSGGNPLAIGRAMESIAQDRDAKLVKEIDDTIRGALEDVLRKSVAPEPADLAGMDELDKVLAQATALMDEGRFDEADVLFGKAEKLEAKRQAREAKAAAKKAAKDAEENAKWERAFALVNDEGWSEIDAEAEVFGVSHEHIIRRNFIDQARRDGHVGKGFDELVGSVHAAMASEQYWQAESDTNGYMIRRQYVMEFNPQDLWTVNDATARKVMSEEMAQWFDDHGGRLTRPILREAILNGSDVYNMTRQQDFNR